MMRFPRGPGHSRWSLPELWKRASFRLTVLVCFTFIAIVTIANLPGPPSFEPKFATSGGQELHLRSNKNIVDVDLTDGASLASRAERLPSLFDTEVHTVNSEEEKEVEGNGDNTDEEEKNLAGSGENTDEESKVQGSMDNGEEQGQLFEIKGESPPEDGGFSNDKGGSVTDEGKDTEKDGEVVNEEKSEEGEGENAEREKGENGESDNGEGDKGVDGERENGEQDAGESREAEKGEDVDGDKLDNQDDSSNIEDKEGNSSSNKEQDSTDSDKFGGDKVENHHDSDKVDDTEERFKSDKDQEEPSDTDKFGGDQKRRGGDGEDQEGASDSFQGEGGTTRGAGGWFKDAGEEVGPDVVVKNSESDQSEMEKVGHETKEKEEEEFAQQAQDPESFMVASDSVTDLRSADPCFIPGLMTKPIDLNDPSVKYLYYERTQDFCADIGHKRWSLSCAFGEAKYLERTLVLDYESCFSASQTGFNNNVVKDIRLLFDIEYLRKRNTVPQSAFLCALNRWKEEHGKEFPVHVLPDPKRAPFTSELKEDSAQVIERKFSENHFFYSVCEPKENSAVIVRDWVPLAINQELIKIKNSIRIAMGEDYDSLHVVRGEKARNKSLWPHLDDDTQPASILRRLKQVIPAGRNLYISSDETTPGFFKPVGERYKVFMVDDFKHLWAKGSDWYNSAKALAKELKKPELREFDNILKSVVDQEVYTGGAKKLKTFNDLTEDSAEGGKSR